MSKLKLSEVVPVALLLHSPYSISKLNGSALSGEDIILVPTMRNYIQKVSALVGSGELHQVGSSSFYFVPSKQSPRVPRLVSLEVEHDITMDELRALHLPPSYPQLQQD